MEEELVSRIPRSLGFFLQPHITTPYLANGAPPPPTFLHCSELGKGLLDGEWGSFDASLCFLDMPRKHIVGSSNGLLLLCADFFSQNSQFAVCNPVTREFQVIPRPDKAYPLVAMTFICKRKDDGASLDKINYEILRVVIPSIMPPFSTTYEIDTFSSLALEWKRSRLVCASPFLLAYANQPGFILDDDDDVIYWRDPRNFLVVYDRTKGEHQENTQVSKLPRDVDRATFQYHLGTYDGKIYYLRESGACDLQIWVLLDTKRGEWVLKHKVTFAEIYRNNPNVVERETIIGYLHPCNSNLVFLDLERGYYWYDIESGKLHEIASKHGIIICDLFLYEWPCVPNSTTGHCQPHSRL